MDKFSKIFFLLFFASTSLIGCTRQALSLGEVEKSAFIKKVYLSKTENKLALDYTLDELYKGKEISSQEFWETFEVLGVVPVEYGNCKVQLSGIKKGEAVFDSKGFQPMIENQQLIANFSYSQESFMGDCDRCSSAKCAQLECQEKKKKWEQLVSIRIQAGETNRNWNMTFLNIKPNGVFKKTPQCKRYIVDFPLPETTRRIKSPLYYPLRVVALPFAVGADVVRGVAVITVGGFLFIMFSLHAA